MLSLPNVTRELPGSILIFLRHGSKAQSVGTRKLRCSTMTTSTMLLLSHLTTIPKSKENVNRTLKLPAKLFTWATLKAHIILSMTGNTARTHFLLMKSRLKSKVTSTFTRKLVSQMLVLRSLTSRASSAPTSTKQFLTGPSLLLIIRLFQTTSNLAPSFCLTKTRSLSTEVAGLLILSTIRPMKRPTQWHWHQRLLWRIRANLYLSSRACITANFFLLSAPWNGSTLTHNMQTRA